MHRHSRSDANKSLRLRRRRKQLRHPLVREAVHADLAIRLWPRPQPSDCFRPIVAFMPERVELALRIAAPAHILNDNVIAMLRKPNGMRINDRRRYVATVRLPHQQRRIWPLPCRIVMIGDQNCSVRQFAAHTALEPDSGTAVYQDRKST